MLFIFVAWMIFSVFGCWIASVKGRSIIEGFVLGCLFGPFGCLIEAVLPNFSSSKAEPRSLATQETDVTRRWLAQLEDEY